MSGLHPNINLHLHFCFCFIFISEFETVHGQMLAVNIAHLRKKLQVTGNETGGENAFKEIVKSTKVHKSLSLTNLFTSYSQIPVYGHPLTDTSSYIHNGQFALSLGKESPYILSKFNPLYTNTPLIKRPPMTSQCPY